MQRLIRDRRKRGLTNYKKRIAQLKGGANRLVVRKSNRGILVQLVAYDRGGDKVMASANSRELAAVGWEPRRNVPTAYLTGLLLAKKAGQKASCILDIGLYRPIQNSVLYAAAKGAKDGGVDVVGNINVDEKRLSGAHISGYAASLGDKGKERQFSSYAEKKFDLAEMPKRFEAAKKSLTEK